MVLVMAQKSQTTTWDVKNLVNNRILTIATGDHRIFPSTVWEGGPTPSGFLTDLHRVSKLGTLGDFTAFRGTYTPED